MHNSEHNHPPTTSGIVYLYLLVSPTPSSPTLLHTPALLSSTLGISTTLSAHPKDYIGNPNQPRHHGSTLILTVFWVVGSCQYRHQPYGTSAKFHLSG